MVKKNKLQIKKVVSQHFVSLLSGLDDPARSSLFRFTSVTVNGEIEQDDSHYTENDHSTYPGTMGDHGLWETGGGGGRREGRRREGKEERGREGEGTVVA